MQVPLPILDTTVPFTVTDAVLTRCMTTLICVLAARGSAKTVGAVSSVYSGRIGILVSDGHWYPFRHSCNSIGREGLPARAQAHASHGPVTCHRTCTSAATAYTTSRSAVHEPSSHLPGTASTHDP